MSAYYTCGEKCSTLFQITEKLIDPINSYHFSTKLFMLVCMYAQAMYSTRQIHINLKLSDTRVQPKLLHIYAVGIIPAHTCTA